MSDAIDWHKHGPALLQAAQNAAATLQAVYLLAERADATSISGIAACHAMLTSLHKNKNRTQKLIFEPINAAVAAATGRAP